MGGRDEQREFGLARPFKDGPSTVPISVTGEKISLIMMCGNFEYLFPLNDSGARIPAGR